MTWTFEATEAGYANMWRSATLKGGADAVQAETFSAKIIEAEQRYKAVQAATGVPWYFIGALHMRESSCNFAGVLHNGEHIIGTGKLTSLVPAGRGPFATWEEAAIDALKLKNMQRVQLWTAPRMLYQTEDFNGRGYIAKGVNSPYVWAGTNHEQLGKYVADRVFDPNAEDKQLGVAAVLIRLAQKRPDIAADLYPATSTEPSPMTPDTDPATPEKQLADFMVLFHQLSSQMKALNDNVALLLRANGQTPVAPPIAEPITPPVPVPVPVPVPAPTTPILEKPGVGIGILGGIVSLVLNALGVTGPMTGEAATTAGQLLPILSGGVAALGATGTFGSILNAVMTVGSMIFQGAQKK